MTFKEIHHKAIEKKEGGKQLNKLLSPVLSQKQLSKVGDDRFLAIMYKAINQAGFIYRDSGTNGVYYYSKPLIKIISGFSIFSSAPIS